MENPTKETEKKNEEIYEVKQHGRTLYTGNLSGCFIYVLNHQPQSVSWALRYGGWSIKNKEEIENFKGGKTMEIICLFGQRKCRDDEEYAPELLAAIDEYGDDDNPEYINEAKEKADKDASFSFSKIIIITVPDKEFNDIFFGNARIEGSIKSGNRKL